MPLLEQRRRTRPASADKPRALIPPGAGFSLLSRRYWPQLWFCCHLLAFAAGGHWAGQLATVGQAAPTGALAVLVRVAALAPALLAGGGNRRALVVWLLVGLCAGLAGAGEGARRESRRTATAAAPWLPASAVHGQGAAAVRTTGWPRPASGDRWSVPAALLAWAPSDATAGQLRPVAARTGLLLRGSGPVPAPGAVLAGRLDLAVPPAATVPGAFDYRRYLTGRGLAWQARLEDQQPVPTRDPVAWLGRRILRPLRRTISGRLDRILPAREAQLSGAVLLGARSPTSRAISAPFAGLGLAHLFAVSGLHVGILLGIVLLPGRLAGASPRAMVGGLWLFVPLYLLLTGMPGSVVRAGGMGLLAAQARPWGRRADPMRLLGLLYWAGSVLAPVQNLDVGLQLSYLAAGGILLVSRCTGGFRFSDRPWRRVILAGLGVSLAAQWFTLPVVAASFGRISLWSPLTNLIAVPLFGLAVWAVVLAVVVSIIWLPLGQWLAAWGWLVLRALAGGVTWLSRRSGAGLWGLGVPGPLQVTIWLGLSVGLLGLLISARRQRSRRARALLGVVAWVVLPVLALNLMGPWSRDLPDRRGGVVAWQFDAGQGDCGLLVFPDGWAALIDTGGRFGRRAGPRDGPLARNILPFLRRQGIGRLDAVLLTHGHRDHTGGAAALAGELPVTAWWVSGHAAAALPAVVDTTTVHRPVAGTVLHRAGPWSLTVEYPLPGQESAPSENNWSLVCALRRNGQAVMVWSGDLELAGEAALLAAAPDLAAVPVWKAGHHGSDTSGSAGFLNLMRPRLVLISCGVGNSYGHPSHGPYVVAGDTLAICRTDLAGSIRLRWPLEGAVVRGNRGHRGSP